MPWRVVHVLPRQAANMRSAAPARARPLRADGARGHDPVAPQILLSFWPSSATAITRTRSTLTADSGVRRGHCWRHHRPRQRHGVRPHQLGQRLDRHRQAGAADRIVGDRPFNYMMYGGGSSAASGDGRRGHRIGIGGPNSTTRVKSIYDNTGMMACDRLASGMEVLVTPQSEKWHGLTVADMLHDKTTDEENIYLERLRNFQFALRYDPRAGFIPSPPKGHALVRRLRHRRCLHRTGRLAAAAGDTANAVPLPILPAERKPFGDKRLRQRRHQLQGAKLYRETIGAEVRPTRKSRPEVQAAWDNRRVRHRSSR